MNREEAIKILKQRECCRECVVDCTCNECDKAFEMAIEALKQEPKESNSENPNKWIPVSERLPEDRESVLFSTKAGIVFEGRFFDDKTNFQWYEYRYKQFEPNNDVTAWTPLPKPYKAESGGK